MFFVGGTYEATIFIRPFSYIHKQSFQRARSQEPDPPLRRATDRAMSMAWEKPALNGYSLLPECIVHTQASYTTPGRALHDTDIDVSTQQSDHGINYAGSRI
jgi:hypothetical protein